MARPTLRAILTHAAAFLSGAFLANFATNAAYLASSYRGRDESSPSSWTLSAFTGAGDGGSYVPHPTVGGNDDTGAVPAGSARRDDNTASRPVGTGIAHDGPLSGDEGKGGGGTRRRRPRPVLHLPPRTYSNDAVPLVEHPPSSSRRDAAFLRQ
ncbi:hypothetical protein ACHAXA_008204 [Cyclostephanos tholiformis]|uniref:Uncharacterized protein n=1 Tax=Cyclostephanos tholiformis TaxID=382380 RepID=A0ABD3SCD5_9STRA